MLFLVKKMSHKCHRGYADHAYYGNISVCGWSDVNKHNDKYAFGTNIQAGELAGLHIGGFILKGFFRMDNGGNYKNNQDRECDTDWENIPKT